MSDVSGYRTDGGALGQDQGLSKQLRNIITAKLPLLNAPGTVLENSLYYDINSSSVQAVEEQETYAKDKIMLNNLVMGAAPSAYIPSVLFAGTVFAQMTLDVNAVYGANGDGATNYFYMPHGWGFNVFDNIVVYMGASSIAQIAISGKSNFLVCMAQCETKSKRQAVLNGAGLYLKNDDEHSYLAGPVNSSSVWRVRGGGDFFTATSSSGVETWLATATVPIRLPWTSLMCLEKRLSFDTKLSTQPIQITLQTKTLDQMCVKGSSVSIASNFSSFSLQLWQEELSDKSLSVRNELLAMPEFNVGYPFQYLQSIDFLTTNIDDGTFNQRFTMNLTSIINSDLTTFLFYVTQPLRSETRSQGDTILNQFCPLYGEELINMELMLNGQRFFAFDDICYKSVTMAKQMSDINVDILMPMVDTSKNSEGDKTDLVELHMYEFNNSRLRSIVSESHMQNTARFTNQTFQLSFNVQRTKNNIQSSKVSTQYVLHMCYCYNGVYLVGGDGGTTKLITN